MHSIMGGTYPGSGITLGPGLTFAWLVARHAGDRARHCWRGLISPPNFPIGRKDVRG